MNKPIRLAVVAAAVGDDPRQAARLARTMGFGGLLFDAYAPAFVVPDLSASGRREFRQVLAAQDQHLVGLRLDLGAKGFGPGADVDQSLSRLEKAMESAAGLMSPLVCVEVGRLPEPAVEIAPKPKVSPDEAGFILLPPSAVEPAPAPTSTPPPDPAFVSQVDAAMSELGHLADGFSVILAFRSELSSFAALDRTIRAASCPWFGIDLDPVDTLRDDWKLDDILSRTGGAIRHVRGRDAVLGSGRRTRAAVVGKGDVKWDELLANLDVCGYQGWITLDPTDLPNRQAAAEEGRRRLAGK